MIVTCGPSRPCILTTSLTKLMSMWVKCVNIIIINFLGLACMQVYSPHNIYYSMILLATHVKLYYHHCIHHNQATYKKKKKKREFSCHNKQTLSHITGYKKRQSNTILHADNSMNSGILQQTVTVLQL